MIGFFKKHPWYPVVIIAVVGILLRLSFVLPGILAQSHERYLRPDSEFYMRAAYSLVNGNGYPGSIRAPGFSATAAVLLKTVDSPLFICAFFALTGGLASLLVYAAAKEYADVFPVCVARIAADSNSVRVS